MSDEIVSHCVVAGHGGEHRRHQARVLPLHRRGQVHRVPQGVPQGVHVQRRRVVGLV